METSVTKKLRKNLKFFLFVFGLLFNQNDALGQVSIVDGSISAQTNVHVVENEFNAGELVIPISFTSNNGNDALVEVTLPSGMNYISGSAQIIPSTLGVSEDISSTVNVPVFKITGITAGTSAVLKIKRKITKQTYNHILQGTTTLRDKVKVTYGTFVLEEKFSNEYSLLFPYTEAKKSNLQGQPEAHVNAFGTSEKDFHILNSGDGTLKKLFFSITYPTGITFEGLKYEKAGAKYALVPVATVGSTYFFQMDESQIPNGKLAKNESIKFYEKYNVKICQASNISYEVGWGEGVQPQSGWYQNLLASRTVSPETGVPGIEFTRANPNVPAGSGLNHWEHQNIAKETYFTPLNQGLCSDVIGAFTISYTNYGTATAYNLKIKLYEDLYNVSDWAYHYADNFRVVNGNTEIPMAITQMTHNESGVAYGGHHAYLADFSNFTNNPNINQGIEDLDGDGQFDDLPVGAKIVIRYDLKKSTSRTYSGKCIAKDIGNFFGFNYANSIGYTNACGTAIVDTGNASSRFYLNGIYRRLFSWLADGSYFPESLVEAGGSKEARLFFASAYDVNLYRKEDGSQIDNMSNYKYEFVVPDGIKASNFRWYITNDFPSSSGDHTTVNPTQENVAGGKKYTFVSTTHQKGYLLMDLEVDCSVSGSGIKQIKYDLKYVDMQGTPQECELKLVCGTQDIKTSCILPGCEGPSLNKTSGERTPYSYGWTDYTMTTRFDANNPPPANMRKRALYLDEVQIVAEGKQHTVATNNLYYTLTLTKGVSLKPKSLKMSINGGAPVTYAGAIPTAVVSGTANVDRQEIITWDLTSLLPATGLQPNDVFEVTTIYDVQEFTKVVLPGVTDAQNRFYDFLALESSQFYMDNNKFCGIPQVPDFFVAETFGIEAYNPFTVDGCKPNQNIGDYLIHMARRFESNGTKFVGEFRPGRRIKKLTFELPKSYKVNNVSYNFLKDSDYLFYDYNSPFSIPLSEFTQTPIGSKIRYEFINTPGKAYEMRSGAMSVVNNYSELLRVEVQPSCASLPEEPNAVKIEVEYDDHYYHYGVEGRTGQGMSYSYNNDSAQERERQITFINKPSVKITGSDNTDVNVIMLEQEVPFTISNQSSVSKAPYLWVSIPKVEGVDVLELRSAGTTTAYPAIDFPSGEKMFRISEEGIDPSQSQNYVLKFRMSKCDQTELKIYAGWNCYAYPEKGVFDATTCGQTDPPLVYVLKPAQSQIQVSDNDSNTQPRKLKMCDDNWYDYNLNSAGAGPIIEPTIAITLERGITVETLLMQYPKGTGATHTITGTDITLSSGKKVRKFDLTTHPAYPQTGIHGTAATNVNDERNVNIRFNIKPQCDFVVGSSFEFDVDGKNICGESVQGNKITNITAGIEGVNSKDYEVTNTLVYESGNANACNGGAIYRGKHIVTTKASTTYTGDNGLITIRIPEGFEYLDQSFNFIAKTGAFPDPTINGLVDAASGGKELSIKIPSGMTNQDNFEYTIKIKQKANAPATDCNVEQKLTYFTSDVANSVHCPHPGGPVCPPIVVRTSTTDKQVAIKVDRAKLEIKNLNVTITPNNKKEDVTATFSITNNASYDFKSDIIVSLYEDSDLNGVVDETEKIKDFSFNNQTIIAGETKADFLINFSVEQIQTCKLYLKIAGISNPCLCEDISVKIDVPNRIDGLVNNFSVCDKEAKSIELNTDIPDYESYQWIASDANMLNYLSDSNIANPTFTYSGVDLTNPLTLTYTLTVTRASGCKSSQEVKVIVNPTPNAPAIVPQQFCKSVTVAEFKQRINPNPNIVKVYALGILLGDGEVMTSNTYQVSLHPIGECESKKADVSVNIASMPTSPTVTNQTFCPSMGAANFVATPTAGHTLRWYDTVTSTTFETNTPSISLNVTTKTIITKYVSQANAQGCESDKVPVTITIDDTQAPVIDNLADLTISCQATDIDNQVNNWLSSVNVTDACGIIANTTNDYATVKPTDWCNVPGNTVTVTITSTDTFGNTSTKTAFIRLVAIDAVEDNFGIVEVNTTTTGSVLDNDKLGTASATTANVEIQNVVSPHTGITISTTDGKVSVANNVPSGVYTLTYTICEKVNGTPCDTATVSITVKNINADNDDFEVSAGGSTGSVLNNDKYDGEFLSSTVSVTLTPIGTLPSGISLDPITGIVRVASGTPSGNYSFNYKICSKVVHSLCDEATVTITVENSIVADNDDLGPVVSGGTTTQTVITNDRLNGTPVVIGTGVGQVMLTPLITPTGITIDATNGKVSVGNNVPSGVYTLTYKICENGATPDNCDEATVTITVENSIVADNDDLGPVVSGGTTTQTVISNDKLNGTPVVIGTGVGQVTLTPLITPTGITIDATNGKVSVGNNVPSGVYTLTYKICENGATPDNCDEATVTITVKNSIVADNDDLGPVVSGGTTTQTVISNDKLNGTPVVIGTGTGEVTLTPIVTPTGITIDATNGKVTVGTNVSSGVYTLTYKICENGATPDNCDEATVTITVQNGIVAEDDDLGTVVSGGTTTQTVITNDRLNGTPVVIGTGVGQVTLTPIITPTGITIDATNGKVTVGTNVSSGVYTLTYKICENGATPDNCDEATVTVTVENGIVAEDDDLGTAVSGGTTTQTVISNDKLNGTPVVIGTGVGEVTLTPIITPTGITIDATNGKVTVGMNVSSGVYTLTYKICENGATPDNCDTATVTITVLSSNTVLAISDINNTYLNTSVSGNVSTNDEDPQGNALEFSLLTASNDQGHSLVFNSDGTYVFTPKEGFTGVVVYEYEVCDKGMPRACATATLTIGVLAQPKDGANTVFAN
ncbi:Ig-like domain-containing protein, partial [Capnocytophaga canimorsus]|uniref:Ig-like domain-containing protein n=1 Tax=Capnocytophaga canimorsus TaxID=28188 RepID=UPI00386DE404